MLNPPNRGNARFSIGAVGAALTTEARSEAKKVRVERRIVEMLW